MQTGAIIEDGHTGRDKHPVVDAVAVTKSQSIKLDDDVGRDGTSCGEAAAESDVKVDMEDSLKIESVASKSTDVDHDTKAEPSEEIDVEVEEFYVKYKNL